MQRYLELLEQFSSLRVAVIGDFLLDEYILGRTSRVSREAPIVIIDYEGRAYHPGGAANAAQNLGAFGATTRAVGVIGDDREGEALADLLRARGVDTDCMVVSDEVPTAVKLRILAGEMNAARQQVARVDRKAPIPKRYSLDTVLDRAKAAVADADAVLISDYGSGLLPGELSKWVIAQARERRQPVVVDSRFTMLGFPGATVATPNEVEALAALGQSEAENVTAEDAGELARRGGYDSMLVTRGRLGMLAWEAGTAKAIGIAGNEDATDVTGAGDTVSAVIALSLAAGSSLVEAAAMATFAASVVVMKRGTATVSPDEMTEMISLYSDSLDIK